MKEEADDDAIQPAEGEEDPIECADVGAQKPSGSVESDETEHPSIFNASPVPPFQRRQTLYFGDASAGVDVGKKQPRRHFLDNFRAMVDLCPHITENNKQMLEYSIIPGLENLKAKSLNSERKFGIVKYIFMILSVLVPALIGLSPVFNKNIGEIVTTVCLTGLAIVLAISAKLYQSFTRSYTGYNTGYTLLEKEMNAFFFMTNEYKKSSQPFELWISRLVSMIYEVKKTDLVSSPVDSSESSIIADITQLEGFLEEKRDEDVKFFATTANLPLLKRRKKTV